MHCQTMTGFILKISENVFESRGWHYFSFHRSFIKSTSHLKAWPKYLGKCLLFERVTCFPFCNRTHSMSFQNIIMHETKKNAQFCGNASIWSTLYTDATNCLPFFSFAKQIANTVCSQAMWMKQNFESENKQNDFFKHSDQECVFLFFWIYVNTF